MSIFPSCTSLGVQELVVFELIGPSLPTLTIFDYATLKHVWECHPKKTVSSGEQPMSWTT